MGIKSQKIAAHTILYIILSFVCLLTLYPVLYAVLGSLKTNMELMMGGSIIPKIPQFKNYGEVWEKANFAQYTLNTLYLCIFATVGALFLSSLTGYCLGRHNFFGKKIVYSIYMFTMFISLGAVTLRPLYLLAVNSGLHATLIPMVIVQIGSQGVNIFLITRFLTSIPKELDESAMIDGCGPFTIYSKILLPLLKPILAVVALFQFRLSWNDYVMPSVFTMTQRALRPLTVGVVSLRYGTGAASEWHLMVTGATISILPLLIIYLFCNKYFMSGLTAGSVKG